MFVNIWNISYVGLLTFVINNIFNRTFSKEYEKVIRTVQCVDFEYSYLKHIILYFIYGFIIFNFIILEKRSVVYAFMAGLSIHGLYNALNMSSFKNWGVVYPLLHTLWGGILFAAVTFLFIHSRKLRKNYSNNNKDNE